MNTTTEARIPRPPSAAASTGRPLEPLGKLLDEGEHHARTIGRS